MTSWYKFSQQEYPYYVAVYREGRLMGQAPMEISMVPSLKRKWDSGGFGTGTKSEEFRSSSIRDLLTQVRNRRIRPPYDNVEFYIVREPNSYREEIQYQRLLSMMREED